MLCLVFLAGHFVGPKTVYGGVQGKIWPRVLALRHLIQPLRSLPSYDPLSDRRAVEEIVCPGLVGLVDALGLAPHLPLSKLGDVLPEFELIRERVRSREDRIDEPDLLCLLRPDSPPWEYDLERLLQSYDLGQTNRAAAPRDEPEFDLRQSDLDLVVVRAHAVGAGQSNLAPPSKRGSVDRGDRGHFHFPDLPEGLLAIASHILDFGLVCVRVEHVDVSPGDEASLFSTCEDDHPDPALLHQSVEGGKDLVELGHQPEIHYVHGPVAHIEDDVGDAGNFVKCHILQALQALGTDCIQIVLDGGHPCGGGGGFDGVCLRGEVSEVRGVR
mmetsp:Transcript_27992/g.68039  ORF Transcript_27992/g.68039 Transcript_27992/m.68039 type:complete len:328 (+) Transcript_27992:757-1740(+)